MSEQQQPQSHQVVKAATGATVGGSLLVLSGLTVVGTVIVLTIATPLLVIVPATITVALLIAGFLASGGFGVAGTTVLSWIYRYVTGKQPQGGGTVVWLARQGK